MSRQLVVVALLALFVISSEALCPSGIRIVNGFVPNPASIDLVINNIALATSVPYGNVTTYFSLTPGSKTVLIRQTSSGNTLVQTTFVAVANVYYTIAYTGATSGPSGELLSPNSPQIFHETIYPPNPNNFRGVFHRLTEGATSRTLSVRNNGNNGLVPSIQQKTAVIYPETTAGGVSFTLLNAQGTTFTNSIGTAIQFNTTLASGVIFDLFTTGDDSSTANPSHITGIQVSAIFDPTSGCTLSSGIFVLPDNTGSTQVSFTPVFCSASTLASGIAFLLALVALFF